MGFEDGHLVDLPGATHGFSVPRDEAFDEPFQEEARGPAVGWYDSDFTGGRPGDVADSRELGVTLAQLQEYLAISTSLKRSCGTLPLTLALWITYLMMVFYHGGAQISFESSNHVRRAIEGCFTTLPGAGGGWEREVRMTDITDHREIMPWIDGALVPMLQTPDNQQVLLGHVRVRQHRGENSTCGLATSLQSFYQSGCYPAGGFVGSYGPHRPKYELAEPSFISKSRSGTVFEFWIEVNRSRAVVSKRVRSLEKEGWIDLSTQDVTIEGLHLNVEEHVYSHFSIAFKMHREGLIKPSLTVYPLRGEIFSHWAQIFLDVFWMGVFVMLMYSAVTETLLEMERGLIKLHLREPFFWLDLSLLVLGGAIVGTFYNFVYWLDKYTDEVYSLGVMPPMSVAEAPDAQKVQSEIDNRVYQDQIAKMIDWVEWFVNQMGWVRFCSVLYSGLMVFRFFRGFTGQPRLALLVQTFLQSAGFVIHFIILLCFIFINFAMAGYILFGEQLQGWTTPTGAIGQMLLVFFLRFDYKEFHEIAPLASAIWFSTFFVLVVVLMQRLMSAAIVDTYLSVKASLGEPGQGLLSQGTKVLRDVLFLRTYKGAQKSVPLEELLQNISADSDPAYLKKLGSRQVDRRLRTRAELFQAESSPAVDVAFLVKRGCEPLAAQRMLEQCAEWTYSISTTSSPLRRLLIMLVRQMNHLRFESEKLQDNMNRKFQRSAKVVDRIDLKHAKCLSLARRIRKGQQLPPGWTAHADKDGRRFMRQEETGLTSWTLPKHLL